MPLPTPLLRRNPAYHKNQFGHVLVLAGSEQMLGAGALCSLAAMRSGAGLVTWGVPKSLAAAAQKKAANVVMVLPLVASAVNQIIKSKSFDAVALGPGLGTHRSTAQFVIKILRAINKPMVVDADALNMLAKHKDILKKTKGPLVITPHPGELQRLTGISKNQIEKNRSLAAKKAAKAFRCVVVLKGHRTVVAAPSGRVYINRTGNVGMATAGSGDVLTGIIAAFLAQGLKPFEAARWGVYIHGKAGDLAARSKTKVAMIASDIIECLPKAFK